MCLINYYKVELFFIFILISAVKDFFQAPVCDKLSFLTYSKQFECTAPVFFKGRGVDNKYICIFTISLNESFGNHCRNHCLAKTNNIREEQSIVLQQHLIALDYRVLLIFQLLDSIGELYSEIILHLVSECLNKNLDI